MLAASWPMWSVGSDDQTEDEPLALVRIDLHRAPPPPAPLMADAEAPGEATTPPDAPEQAEEQPAPVAARPPEAAPQTIAFVLADQAELESTENAEGEVISAVTDDSRLDLSAEIVAPESGKQAPQQRATQAAPTSVAVAAAAGAVAEPQHAAPKVESTPAEELGASTEGNDVAVTPELENGTRALQGGEVASAERTPEVPDAPPSEEDGQADAEVEQLAGHDGHTQRDDEMAPSIALYGASGAAGGAATSAQAVIEDGQQAMRARTRRANTPLGRYTQRVYRAVQRRWHEQPIEVMPIPCEVVVTFSIHRLGRVERVHLARSSGDPMLDAIATASVPKRLAPFPADLHEQNIRQEITFRYVP